MVAIGRRCAFHGGTSRAEQPADRKRRGLGVDSAAVAVAWLLAHPATILPVLGTNDLNRISGISDALKVRLDRQDWFEIYQMANGHEVA